MVEDLASPLTLLTLVYCELCWHVLLFWNRLGRSQQTASEKVFWSGRLLDLRWIRSAGRSILSALHAPQTCLLFLWMEIASTTALRMQQGTFKMCVICSVVKVTLAVSYWRSMCIFLSFRSEEKALFDGIFIAKDDEVERFVDYIHSTTNHVNLFYNISKKKKTPITSWHCLGDSLLFITTFFHFVGLWKRCLWRGVVSCKGNVSEILK